MAVSAGPPMISISRRVQPEVPASACASSGDQTPASTPIPAWRNVPASSVKPGSLTLTEAKSGLAACGLARRGGQLGRCDGDGRMFSPAAAAVEACLDPADHGFGSHDWWRHAPAGVRFAADQRALFELIFAAGLDKSRYPGLAEAGGALLDVLDAPSPDQIRRSDQIRRGVML
jgi:hypothetical protein